MNNRSALPSDFVWGCRDLGVPDRGHPTQRRTLKRSGQTYRALIERHRVTSSR